LLNKRNIFIKTIFKNLLKTCGVLREPLRSLKKKKKVKNEFESGKVEYFVKLTKKKIVEKAGIAVSR